MTLKQTPLHSLHQEHNARFTDFAGFEMPLQYVGIKLEHLHTRTRVSLFDISHMGLLQLAGNNPEAALERLVPGDIRGRKQNQQCYTLLLNEQGGIIDDLMVTRTDDGLLLVVNAACREKDRAFLQHNLPDHCRLTEITDHVLLALQGPDAATVLANINPGVPSLSFMTARRFRLLEADCYISRSGYTGEDGFELMVSVDQCRNIANTLLQQRGVKPAGLGARDTLRLEAGLCLYGHELDEETTPIEAGLSWTISRDRLAKEEVFHGVARIRQELEQGTTRIRCGLLVEGRVPVREGVELLDNTGHIVGRVSSGGFSPSLEQPVAMAYVNTDCIRDNTALHARIRNKKIPLRMVPLPFIKHRYKNRQ